MNATFPTLETNVQVSNDLRITKKTIYIKLRWSLILCSKTPSSSPFSAIHLHALKVQRALDCNTIAIINNNKCIKKVTYLHYTSIREREEWLQALNRCTGWKLTDFYRTLDFLGSGTFGQVFRAERLSNRATFAVKMVDNKKLLNFNEIVIMTKLQHAHLLTAVDVLSTKEKTAIILPLMDSDLDKLVEEKGPLFESQARIFMKQILQGLEYMHSYCVAHRDLKLTNIMCKEDLDGNVSLKISDFGGAAILRKGTKFWPGTPFYLPTTPISQAPEQILKKPYGLEADIFSCGGILFELLTGKKPYMHGGRTVQDLFDKILANDWAPIPNTVKLSDQVLSLIRKMLVSEPEERISVTEALADPWFQEQ